MNLRSAVCIPFLLLVLAVPAFGSVVVIERPDGVCHLDLSVEQDGPIWLPVDAKQLDAVQLATKVSGEIVRVTVWAVRDGAVIDLVGEYDLALGSEPAVVWELARYGVEGWSLGLTLAGSAACSGGCGCGGICCYPDPGKCISCSSCGSCCAAPSET